jgi:uncharacterized protein YqgV (UPF0045/DUF77 family)
MYAHVDVAIAAITASGLAMEVGALGTTVDGHADDVWRVARAAHDACLASGATSCVTVLKVFSTASGDDPGLADLVGAHRSGGGPHPRP